MVATALAISLVIAFPLRIWTARRPALYVATMTITGIPCTVPALALFALVSLHCDRGTARVGR
jgi:ABC-type proline/glycine betaine transport system permease subunit